MNELPIKICSKCGGEYSVEAQACADCGGALVFPQDYEKHYEAPVEEEAFVLVREAPFGYLKELLEHLTKKGVCSGIRFHTQEEGSCSPSHLWGVDSLL